MVNCKIQVHGTYNHVIVDIVAHYCSNVKMFAGRAALVCKHIGGIT